MRAEEFPFGHRRVGERDIGAGVLEHQRPLEKVLHRADALDDVRQRLFVERNRQQIVRVHARHARPAQVVRDPARLRSRPASRLSFARYSKFERVGAADRQRDAVHHDRVSLGDLLQHVARPTAGSMKFSEMISNQSTGGPVLAEDVAKCTVRSPTPSPRSGSHSRGGTVKPHALVPALVRGHEVVGITLARGRTERDASLIHSGFKYRASPLPSRSYP